MQSDDQEGGYSLMADSSSPTGSSAVRLIPVIVAVVVTGLLVFVACSVVWYHLGGGAWRSEVRVIDVKLGAPDTLILSVGSCHGAPRASVNEETDAYVQVEAVAFSTPLHSRRACIDDVKAYLREPLGDRAVVDKRSGKIFSGGLQPYASAKPQSNWRLVEVPGLPNQPGFTLRLPFGWELHNLQGANQHSGEIIGEDGIRLRFDYGETASSLDPADDPAHDYFVIYENIGGLEAKLLISSKGNGYIGVYFPSLGGPSLSFAGKNLAPSQQQAAMAVFRSVSLLGRETGDAAPPLPEEVDAAAPEIDDAISEAELQDLQAVADQYGISLQEAIERYAWNDNFSEAVSRVREAAPAAFAGAEIVDADHAWVAFAGQPPKTALDIIDTFTSSYSGVSVEVRTNQGFTEAELKKAIPAVHYAVLEAPEVLDASTSFDSATGQIRTVVVLDSTASASVLDDLGAVAVKSLTDATRPDILNSITISVVRSDHPILGGYESSTDNRHE